MLLIILSCVALCIYLWILRRQNKDDPPTFSGSFPFIGHARLLLGDSVKLWNTIKEYSIKTTEVGGVAAAWIGPIKIYLLTDPEDFATVANTCLKKSRFYEFGRAWLGQGLVTGTFEKWKIHRRLINPAFNQIVLDGFIDIFNSQSRRLVKDFEQNIGMGPFDHFPYIRHNALETICLTAIGVDFTDETMQNSEYVIAIENILNIIVERIQKIWFHSDFIFNLSPTKKRQDKYLKIVRHVSNTILKNRKDDYLKNRNIQKNEEVSQSPKFKPFMDLILELSEEKKILNDTEVREHVDTIIAAGHDTSAAVLVYTLVLVGSFPDVQEKIIEELKYIFGDDDRDVTKHDISKLIYLEAVLKESMRYFTIAPVTARILDKDVKLRNCTLSKGHTCFILGHGLHRHPVWGPDANEFIPERWLDPAKLPKVPSAYAAFHTGKRVCIGKSYAYMSMKITLSHLFKNYKISGDYTKVISKSDVLLKPVSGHHIIIERRK